MGISIQKPSKPAWRNCHLWLWKVTSVASKGADTPALGKPIWYFSVCAVTEHPIGILGDSHTDLASYIETVSKILSPGEAISTGSHRKGGIRKHLSRQLLMGYSWFGVRQLWAGDRLFPLPLTPAHPPSPVPFIQQVFIKGPLSASPSAEDEGSCEAPALMLFPGTDGC